MSNYPSVLLTEEGMRDGLQIERADIPVEGKIRLLDMLSETGLKEIAVGSFVSPRSACADDCTPSPSVAPACAPGISSAVRMAFTPGIDIALLVSSRLTRACGIGLVSSLQKSIPSARQSSA